MRIAFSEINSGNVSAAENALKDTVHVIAFLNQHGSNFNAFVTLQAVVMAIKIKNLPLAVQLAILLMAEVQDYAQLLWKDYDEHFKRQNYDQAKISLLKVSYAAITFFPFIPSQLFEILGRFPNPDSLKELAQVCHYSAKSIRPLLEAHHWQSWQYPEQLEQESKFWSARILVDYGRMRLNFLSSGRDLQDVQMLGETCLSLIQNVKPDQLDADVYNLLGRVFSNYNNYELTENKAIPYFEKSIAILEEIENQQDAAVDRANLGALFFELGRFYKENKEELKYQAAFDQAEENLKKALAIQNNLDAEDQIIAMLNTLGSLYYEKNDYQHAVPIFNQLLERIDESDQPGSAQFIKVLANVGNTLRRMRHFDNAEKFLSKAVQSIEKNHPDNIDPESYIFAYGSLGDVFRQKGAFDNAFKNLTRAIDKLESFRCSFISERSNIGLVKGFRWIYEAMIDCCAVIGVDQPEFRIQSLNLVEKLKWQIFTTALKYREDLLPFSTANDPLLKEEQRLLKSLFHIKLSESSNAAELVGADRDMQRLEEIWNQWQDRYPQYVSIRRGENITVQETCHLLDDAVPILVAYFLGDELETALAFVVQQGEPIPQIVRLEKTPEQISELVNELRNYTTTDDQPLEGFKKISQELHQVLVKPILTYIPAGKGVCIVPYGSLHNLPFGSLFDATQQVYWIERNPIVIAPSATALRWWISKDKRTAESCLIFAATDVKDPGMASLSFFEDVAKRYIQPLFETCKFITTGEATKPVFIQEIIDSGHQASWDVLHIASHGVFDTANSLQSFLMMQGDPGDRQKNLTALEIFTQIRTKATLVTLSACESGIALASTGDDIAGLAQAFLFGGASSVLSTLWLLNIGAGYDFTRRFYSLWLGDAKHPPLSKLQALQQSQVEMIHKKELFGLKKPYSHPYYWAVFQLYGDWK